MKTVGDVLKPFAMTGVKPGALTPDNAFETITEERYNEMMKSLTSVDLTKVIENEDNTDLQGEIACAGGVCEI